MDERCIEVDDCINKLGGIVSEPIEGQELDWELRSLVPKGEYHGNL
jgi:hypothetical protein